LLLFSPGIDLKILNLTPTSSLHQARKSMLVTDSGVPDIRFLLIDPMTGVFAWQTTLLNSRLRCHHSGLLANPTAENGATSGEPFKTGL
jgi:hypothetical protein